MYLPNHFSVEDFSVIRNFINENSFATLMSYPHGHLPFINHLPIIFSSQVREENILIGHMSKKNPQWHHFKDNPEATIIIHGPHTYITPKWYKSGRDVPTWNYAIVHLQGQVELSESFESQVEVLKIMSHFFEKDSSDPWNFELPSDLNDKSSLTAAIVSFRFTIKSYEAKFKLSQNRSTEDRIGIIEGLSHRNDDFSKSIQQMMLKNEEVRK